MPFQCVDSSRKSAGEQVVVSIEENQVAPAASGNPSVARDRWARIVLAHDRGPWVCGCHWGDGDRRAIVNQNDLIILAGLG
jgi:hypothetical protein